MSRPVRLVVVSMLAAACASSTPSAPPPTSPQPSPATTTAPAAPTTSPATTAASGTTATSAATTTALAEPTTSMPCAATGTTGETNVEFPQRMSALVGVDIRTGARPCYERLVIELAPAPDAPSLELPGYWLRYTRSPVTDSPRGEPVEVRGDAVLLVQMGAWMGNMDGFGYRGPYDLTPTNVRHIRQLLLVENFEGQSAWAVGVDAVYPYTAFTLDGPPRLVIDLLVG